MKRLCGVGILVGLLGGLCQAAEPSPPVLAPLPTEDRPLAERLAVPQGQRTPAELLVFLQTANGDRFLAGTGHYLNMPGSGRAYAMFSQFKPFGETRGDLDLSQVASISIGWGGYLGTAGERIIFTVKPPQRFVCGAK